MFLYKSNNSHNSFRYPDGVPDNFSEILSIEDLPPTTNIRDWAQIRRPCYLIKTLSNKEVKTDISYEYINELKQPVILTTTIREAKKLCKKCPFHQLVLFGMKEKNKLLLMSINGEYFAFHKLWYLFCRDLYQSDYQIVNENDDDLIVIGLGFHEPTIANEPYLFCWGDNIQKSHCDHYSQNVYLISDGSMVQRYSIN